MKKHVRNLLLFIVILSLNSNLVMANTANKDVEKVEVEIEGTTLSVSIENDSEFLKSIKDIESTSWKKGDKNYGTIQYSMEDGSIVVDKYEYTVNKPLSTQTGDNMLMAKISSGSVDWSGSRSINYCGTISMSASFVWEPSDEYLFDDGKVKCTSMSANYSIKSTWDKITWNKSKSSSWVYYGKAYAKVKYHFATPASGYTTFKRGTFKVTCSDSGSIN